MSTKKKSGLFPRLFNTLLKNTEYDDLCKAAEKGDLPGFINILEAYKRSVTVNGQPPHKIPMHHAAANNQNRIIQYILSKRGRIGLKNEKGQSALHVAVDKNNPDTVTILLHAGLDMGWKDRNGKTALEYAWDKRNNECAMILETWPFVKKAHDRVGKLNMSAKARAKKYPEVTKYINEFERKKTDIDREVLGSLAGITAKAAAAAVDKFSVKGKTDKDAKDEKGKKKKETEEDRSNSDSSVSD